MLTQKNEAVYTKKCIFFSLYIEYLICMNSLSRFSDVFPAFTSARAIANL